MTLSTADGGRAKVPMVGAGVHPHCAGPSCLCIHLFQTSSVLSRRGNKAGPHEGQMPQSGGTDKCSEWRDRDSVLRTCIPHRGSNQSKAVELGAIRGTRA